MLPERIRTAGLDRTRPAKDAVRAHEPDGIYENTREEVESMKRKAVITANGGWVSEAMGYRAAMNYAEKLYLLGNYNVFVVRLP